MTNVPLCNHLLLHWYSSSSLPNFDSMTQGPCVTLLLQSVLGCSRVRQIRLSAIQISYIIDNVPLCNHLLVQLVFQ